MIDLDATGPSNLIRSRFNRALAFKFSGSQFGKCEAPASDEDKTLYETMRVRIGASDDFIASCSSSGEDAKSSPSPKSGDPFPFDGPLLPGPPFWGFGVVESEGTRGKARKFGNERHGEDFHCGKEAAAVWNDRRQILTGGRTKPGGLTGESIAAEFAARLDRGMARNRCEKGTRLCCAKTKGFELKKGTLVEQRRSSSVTGRRFDFDLRLVRGKFIATST